MKLDMVGWNSGLKKITLTRLMREYIGLSLKQAKTNTDLLLDNNKISFEFESLELMIEFNVKINSIGVITKIDNVKE